MNDPILHHHDPSPFGEKIRLALGLKGLAWRSVQVSMVMPRPELGVLTGGYRKIPVLQVGADVYCDTRLIVRELERRYPQPTLFPQGSLGLSLALTPWSDRSFFDPGAGLSMGLNKAFIPKAVIDDRKSFFNFMDFDALESDIPHLYTQFRAGLELVELMLADGRPFVLGSQVSYADIDAYFPVWMARGNIGTAADLLAPFKKLREWESRMVACSRGTRSEISADDALALAKASTPHVPVGVDASDPLGFTAGDRVCVAPDDYGKIPVEGDLVTLTINEVAVRRHTVEAGEIVTHFPRLGYRITRV